MVGDNSDAGKMFNSEVYKLQTAKKTYLFIYIHFARIGHRPSFATKSLESLNCVNYGLNSRVETNFVLPLS